MLALYCVVLQIVKTSDKFGKKINKHECSRCAIKLVSLLPLSQSYYTTVDVTPWHVGGCGPNVATGEWGKYQRRSKTGGAAWKEEMPK